MDDRIDDRTANRAPDFAEAVRWAREIMPADRMTPGRQAALHALLSRLEQAARIRTGRPARVRPGH